MMKTCEERKKFDERKAVVGNLSTELNELDKMEISLSEANDYFKGTTVAGGGFLTIICC